MESNRTCADRSLDSESVRFPAPLGTATLIITLFSLLLFASVGALLWNKPSVPEYLRILYSLAIVLTIFFCYATAPTAYWISDNLLIIECRLSNKSYLLHSPIELTVGKKTLTGSIRLFGNGGLFGFTGWYWKKSVGRFRAHISDPARTVLIRMPAITLAISPSNPIQFVQALQARFPGIKIKTAS